MFSPKSDSTIVVFAHRGLRAGRCPKVRGGSHSNLSLFDVEGDSLDGGEVAVFFDEVLGKLRPYA
ncbi:MAG: hypothetical protein HFACDABA_00367 [Anaerolineales bacterium]|nr:hypothetical protein [Anaerolineales bacterium]